MKSLRTNIFNITKTTLPNGNYSEGYDLLVRRKKTLLAEDIYILGNSLVNKREDTRLCAILKPVSSGDTSLYMMDSQYDGDASLLENQATLKSSMDQMVKLVNQLTTRVTLLESEVTVLRTSIIQLSVTNGKDVSKDKIPSSPSVGKETIEEETEIKPLNSDEDPNKIEKT